MAKFIENMALGLLAKYPQRAKAQPLQSLANAKEIGVVYDVHSTSTESLREIIDFFKSKDKNIVTLGFVNEKELGEYVPNYKQDYFCKKDLNFWKLPKQDNLIKFLNKEFDFLLNLDLVGSLQLQAVSTFCKSKTRMGKHFDEYVFAQDFMIKSDAVTAADLFTEIKKYLK